jgi:putative hydrolase of the HAD superfamily
MIKAILFDLDDTLYVEGDFFRSGFSVVASELEARGTGRGDEIAAMLTAIHFGESREKVFQKAAARIPFPEDWIPELVTDFRSHQPRISLAPDVSAILRSLRAKYCLGCVTDGWAEVQRRKIMALGIIEFLDALVVADDMGRAFWKPNPLPIHRCCELLGVPLLEAIFVGDNPERDIKGARNAGIRNIRIRRKDSYFYAVDCVPPDVADYEINDFTELENVLAQLDDQNSMPGG